jgi:hypothetical protein
MATANLLGAAIYAARVITTNFRMATVSWQSLDSRTMDTFDVRSLGC